MVLLQNLTILLIILSRHLFRSILYVSNLKTHLCNSFIQALPIRKRNIALRRGLVEKGAALSKKNKQIDK